MKVEIFPKCCGAGVLILEHLTGKGEAADLELIRNWVGYAKRNGYHMYDFPQNYDGKSGDPKSSVAVLGGPTDRQTWERRSSWGMLLAITSPGQEEAAQRLRQFGFKELFKVWNPVYSDKNHKITLWGLDMNDYTEAQLRGDQPLSTENPFATMTGTLGCLATGAAKPRGPDGRFLPIAKAPVADVL